MAMGIAIANGKTIVDEWLESREENPQYMMTLLNFESALEDAKRLLEYLEGYDANLADLESVPPTIIVRLGKTIVYNVVLGRRIILTGARSLRIIEKLIPYLLKISEHGMTPVLIFYSWKGRLTLCAYLFLGYIIEKYGVGILFVNGREDEILEILWSLENKGSFTPEEEDYVEV